MKSAAHVLAALLAILSAAAQPAANLQQAQQSFNARDFKQSAILAESLAATTQDLHLKSEALLLQAKSLVNLEDFPHAEAVLRMRPESAESLYLLGYVLQRRNNPRESLATFTRAAALAPPRPDDLKLVALDYVLLNDYPDAVHWLERALAADAANEEAWYYLGRAHMQLGNFVLADANFRRALALNPDDPKALDNLGLALEAQNRNEDAAVAYRRAITAQRGAALRLKSEQPLLNLATLLNNKNQSAEALPLLLEAVELAPQSVRCQEELSRAYMATAEPARGIAAMQRAAALAPEDPRVHYRLSQLYRRAGESARADAEAQLSTRLYASHSTDDVP